MFCREQNYVSFDAVPRVILVQNSSETATVPRFRIWRNPTETRDVTRGSSERGGETSFALRFGPPFGFPPITYRCRRSQMREAAYELRRVFGEASFRITVVFVIVRYLDSTLCTKAH